MRSSIQNNSCLATTRPIHNHPDFPPTIHKLNTFSSSSHHHQQKYLPPKTQTQSQTHNLSISISYMATTIASLKWNHTFSIHLPPPSPPRLLPTTATSFTRPVKFSGTLNLNLQSSSKLSVKCFIFTNKNKNHVTTDLDLSSDSKTQNPFEVFANTLLNALKALRKPAVAAVLLGLLLLYDPNSALAASGGRMGGRSFSSNSSSSSRSYSVPRNSGGGFSFSAPYYAPSPFGGGGGFYMGPAVGVGSSFFFILMGFAAFVLVSGVLSDRSEGGVLTATEKTSVVKLQVLWE